MMREVKTKPAKSISMRNKTPDSKPSMELVKLPRVDLKLSYEKYEDQESKQTPLKRTAQHYGFDLNIKADKGMIIYESIMIYRRE